MPRWPSHCTTRLAFPLVALLLAPRFSAPIVALLILLSLVRSTPEQLAQLLMVLLIGCLCIRERTALHPVLSWRPLAYVGKISYGIYLMHMLCANVARRAIGERFGVALFCLTVVTVILVASISYRWLEKPLLRLGHRWSGRPSVVRSAATAAATA